MKRNKKLFLTTSVGLSVLIILVVLHSSIPINENALFAAATVAITLAGFTFVAISILLMLGNTSFMKYLIKKIDSDDNKEEGELLKLFKGMIEDVFLLAFSSVALIGALVFKNELVYIFSLSFFSFSFTHFILYLLYFEKVIKATLRYRRNELLHEEERKMFKNLKL